MFHSRSDSSSRSHIFKNWLSRRSGDKESFQKTSESKAVAGSSLGNTSLTPTNDSIFSLESSRSFDEESKQLVPSDVDKSLSDTCGTPSSLYTERCVICGNLDDSRSIPWSNIKESGARGCEACQLLVTGIDKYFEVAFIGLRRGDDILGQPEAEKLLRVHLHSTRGALKVGVGWADRNGLFDQCEFYTEVNERPSPWKGLGAARSVTNDRKDSFKVLQGWIQECMMSHPGCNTDGGTLPLRVVDVGFPGFQRPHLYVSQNKPDFYTALSHCWGSSALLRTTKSNLESHKKEICWSDLSKTFRDAIIMTQDLGIRYLWIDSICILQDDDEDWQIQSSQMASIYSKAQVVLAATDAKDGTDGLLFDHPSRPAKKIVKRTRTGLEYNVYVRNVRRHFSFRLQYGGAQLEYPLFQRAWAFQEQLLASRVIHFTKSELIWECKSELACECMDLDSFDPKSAKLLYHKSLTSTVSEDKFSNWQKIVTSYMGKHITFERDRIPALAGLAAQMQDAGAGQYLAGLWRENLPMDLLWEGWTLRRPVPLRAPTWCWTSTEGAGSYGSIGYIPMGRAKSNYVTRVRAKVLEVQWEPTNQLINSEIKGGALSLAAPIIEVDARLSAEDTQHNYEMRYKGLRRPWTSDLNDVNLGVPTFCLLVVEARVLGNNTFHGIILQRTDQDETYQRIGSSILIGSEYHKGYPSEGLHLDLWFKGIKDSVVNII